MDFTIKKVKTRNCLESVNKYIKSNSCCSMVDEVKMLSGCQKDRTPNKEMLKSCSDLKGSNKAPETRTIIIHVVEGRGTFLSEFSLAFVSNHINEN